MAVIHDRESLENWLKVQPSEVAVIIAARAALRVLPRAISVRDFSQNAPGAVTLLSCLRAAAVAWTAGTWPSQATRITHAASAAAAAAGNAKITDTAVYPAVKAIRMAAEAASDYPTLFAAVYAADAISHATDFAASTRLQEINYDAEMVELRSETRNLGLEPLWPVDIPQDIRDYWNQFLNILPYSGYQNWNVWTNWYQDRLLGVGSSRPIIADLEIARVSIGERDWSKGPAHVNSLIARLELRHRGVSDEGDFAQGLLDLEEETSEPDPVDASEITGVPAQRPAIVEVEVGRDRRLHRRMPPPPEADDAEADADLRDAYEAHRAILNALTRSDPGRNWPDLKLALADYADALGTSYDGMNVIAAGVHGERLGQFVLRAEIELMEGAAADLTSLFTAHAVFIRQFPRWRHYLDRNRPPPDPQVVQAAVETAGSLKDFPGLFGDDVVEAAERQAAPIRDIVANSEDRLPPIVESSLVDSILNVTYGASAPTAEFLKDATGEGREAALDLAYVATFLGLASVSNLVLKLPMELTFVPALLALIAKRQLRKPKAPAKKKSNDEV